MQESHEHLTLLLGKAATGDEMAREQLFDLVYDTLHRKAYALVAREGRNRSLQPTDLVHEAYFRLFLPRPLNAPNRAYFFGAAATAMRRILIEHARKNVPRTKLEQVPLIDEILEAVTIKHRVDVLDVDRALIELERINGRHAQVVTLRFFGGLKWTEIATCLDVSTATAEKDWQARGLGYLPA